MRGRRVSSTIVLSLKEVDAWPVNPTTSPCGGRGSGRDVPSPWLHESGSGGWWPPPCALSWSQASPSAFAKWSSTEPVMDTELDTGSASL